MSCHPEPHSHGDALRLKLSAALVDAVADAREQRAQDAGGGRAGESLAASRAFADALRLEHRVARRLLDVPPAQPRDPDAEGDEAVPPSPPTDDAAVDAELDAVDDVTVAAFLAPLPDGEEIELDEKRRVW